MQYANLIYGDAATNVLPATENRPDASDDIEAEINMEVQEIQSSKVKQDALFVPVKIDVQCGNSTPILLSAATGAIRLTHACQ